MDREGGVMFRDNEFEFDEHLYVPSRVIDDITYYVCKFKNRGLCPGRGRTRAGAFSLIAAHNHLPDIRLQAERSFRQELFDADWAQPISIRRIYDAFAPLYPQVFVLRNPIEEEIPIAPVAPRDIPLELPPARNDNDSFCCICRDNFPTHCFVPCGHQGICEDCVPAYQDSVNAHKCPGCRKDITMIIKIYKL